MPKTNLLIIHQGALGDLVATFPAIIQLRSRFRQIDGFCQGSLGKLACDLHLLDSRRPLEAAYFASLYSNAVHPRLQDTLRSYQEIVLFSFSEQLDRSISKIKGHRVHRIPPRAEVSEKVHVTEHILSNLARCGLLDKNPMKPADFTLRIGTSPVRNGSPDPLRVLIHPGSGSQRKLWPIENFIETEAFLKSDGMKPEFILGPAEEYLAGILAADGSCDRTLHTPGNLSELAWLLQSAGGFIGNDSGVSHLSAFLGLPTVAVFGASDPERWRPCGPKVKIIRPELECHPCFEIRESNCSTPECFSKTSPEKVLEAFYELDRR